MNVMCQVFGKEIVGKQRDVFPEYITFGGWNLPLSVQAKTAVIWRLSPNPMISTQLLATFFSHRPVACGNIVDASVIPGDY